MFSIMAGWRPRRPQATGQRPIGPWWVLFLAAVIATTFAGMASASVTPRVDRREARQWVRIHQGVRSGQLTRGEAMWLRGGERRIRCMERIAKSDGVVTPRERLRLQRALDRESRAIFRLKHNHRVRIY